MILHVLHQTLQSLPLCQRVPLVRSWRAAQWLWPAAVMLTQQLTTPGTRRTRGTEGSPTESRQIFTITNITAEHGGKYQCEAQNTQGRSNTTLHLTVGAGDFSTLTFTTYTPPLPPYHCTRTLNHQNSGFPDVSKLYIKPSYCTWTILTDQQHHLENWVLRSSAENHEAPDTKTRWTILLLSIFLDD